MSLGLRTTVGWTYLLEVESTEILVLTVYCMMTIENWGNQSFPTRVREIRLQV